MSLVYLASPYTAGNADPFERECRYIEAMRACAMLLRKGQHVYSPIVHCHELAKIADLPRDGKFWQAYNFALLRRCHEVVVLTLPGWAVSEGVTAEVFEARRHSIPIRYLSWKNHT